VSKKTINVVVRFSEEELAIAESKRRRLESEIKRLLPGIDFTISSMLRSLAIAGHGPQRKHRITSQCKACRTA